MKWEMPEWMAQYCGKYIPDKKTCEWHMNENKVNVVVNAPLAMDVVATKAQIQTLTRLYDDGFMPNTLWKANL